MIVLHSKIRFGVGRAILYKTVTNSMRAIFTCSNTYDGLESDSCLLVTKYGHVHRTAYVATLHLRGNDAPIYR